MVRNVAAVLVLGLILLEPAFADTFELKKKKIKVTKKNAEVLPEIELRPQEAIDLSKEPKYRSDHPQKFVAHFGENNAISVAFAVDEKRGTGKGYDYLYADVKGMSNLANGKKLPGKTSHRGYSYEDTHFANLEIQIQGINHGEGYPLKIRFSTRKDTPSDSSLYLTPLMMLEGPVKLGERQLQMMVFDANCNGVFGEAGKLKRGIVEGDRIWIGRGSPKVEEAYAEALPLGRYFLFDGQYFEIAFNEGLTVEVKKANVPMGRIKVNNPGFLLELVERDTVLYVSCEKASEADVPVGNYKINNVSFRRKYKGKMWELEGKPGTCNEGFHIQEGSMTEIEVGPPLKIVITSNTRPQGNGLMATLRFSISGNSGETYQYLRMAGKKVDLPEISIRDPRNKEVEKGHFEYG